jgi:2-polyprenyl-6-methoxyphenol hydroxylase-like FAD-dependent oxidoreductase
MGGLLAARALSESYDEVSVLERDSLPTEPGNRRGVQQGRHAHGLLARGREVLEELFPGLTEELVAASALVGDMQSEARWYNDGHRMKQAASGLDGLMVSRPLLEFRVRERVAALPGVRIVQRADVLGLATGLDGRSVTGVRLLDADGRRSELAADLVVDATGRGSRGPHWLAELGYRAPDEEKVEIGVAYATRTYRRRPSHLNGDLALIVGPTPHIRRLGVALAMEDDRWIISLGGYLGDVPPTDPAAFDAFARTLAQPDIADLMAASEPLDDPLLFRYPRSVRRRYERLREFPNGYLAFGDAICSFNPIYGQGMTVASLEALALRKCLNQGDDRLAHRFFRAASRLIDVPWSIAVGGDLRFPEVAGKRTAQVKLVNAYIARLHRAARYDAKLGRAFLRVANLIDRPERLLRPAIAIRVLRAGAPHRGERAITPVPEPAAVSP